MKPDKQDYKHYWEDAYYALEQDLLELSAQWIVEEERLHSVSDTYRRRAEAAEAELLKRSYKK